MADPMTWHELHDAALADADAEVRIAAAMRRHADFHDATARRHLERAETIAERHLPKSSSSEGSAS